MINNQHNETVQSRFDDIKRDGPNIYTGLLENIDNSIDWGKANKIEIIHNRESITIKDNGPNGFGSIEALERFFTIGKRNEEGVTESTIGKYGKGGYKATISMGNRVEITTYFNGNEHTYGTNFIEMEEKNSMEPTMKLEVKKNTNGGVGTHLKIFLRHDVGPTYSSREAQRHFIRAYHNYKDNIKFSLRSGKEVIEFDPKDHCPYDKVRLQKNYYIYYQKEDNRFIYKNKKKKGSVMEVQAFVLQERISMNPYLSTRKPGIDFYRCGRMCNTRYPVFNIGNVGNNITQGQMRGMRCHIICQFNDTKLTDLLSMDDYIGVTTVKDIYEDDRMDKSLIEILEEISKDTSLMYENLITEQKNSFNTHIQDIETKLKSMRKMEDDILLEDSYDLDTLHGDFDNYMKYQAYYFNADSLEFKYCDSKEGRKEKEKSGECTKCTKSNAIYKNIRDNIIPLIISLQQRKKELNAKEVEIQSIMKEYSLVREEAKEKYIELLHIKNTREVEEKRKKHLQDLLNNATSYYQSKDYDEAKSLYKEYINTKDGECNDIKELIKKVTEEQICNLRKELTTALENKEYDNAFQYSEDLIDINENLNDEMKQVQEDITILKIKEIVLNAEENVKDKKYNEALKLYEGVLSEYTLKEEEKDDIDHKITEINELKVAVYKKKVEDSLSINSFKQAKKYNGYIQKINLEKSVELGDTIDREEEVYTKRIQTITLKDIDNMYQCIIKGCKCDKNIQMFYKVLEHYHNNP